MGVEASRCEYGGQGGGRQVAEGQRAIKAEDQFYAWLRNNPARLSKPLTIPLGSDLLRAVEMVKVGDISQRLFPMTPLIYVEVGNMPIAIMIYTTYTSLSTAIETATSRGKSSCKPIHQ
jgi:hypothetical protein